MAAAIAFCLAPIPARLQAQTLRACQPNDSTSAALQNLGVGILTDTTAGAIQFRAKYGIPAGSASNVVRVVDDTVCEAATAAIEASGAPHQSEALVVVRLFSTDPVYLVGKRVSLAPLDAIFVLDSQFKILVTLR
jgi:hypothetical protein